MLSLDSLSFADRLKYVASECVVTINGFRFSSTFLFYWSVRILTQRPKCAITLHNSGAQTHFSPHPGWLVSKTSLIKRFFYQKFVFQM